MILIVYVTVDGQAKKIADKLEKVLEQNGCIVKVADMSVVSKKQLETANKIVVIASIRYGKFPKILFQFVAQNAHYLKEKAGDFVGINLIARNPAKAVPQNNVYVRKFLEKIDWEPNHVAIFAGALLYSKYHFFDKKMIQLIMYLTKGPTDSSQDIEFTDWEKVEQFGIKLVEER
ncbi:menaquinone-dependent protoporphyrinogen IX dehydrogenase [Vagococcus entomophilus]|uniref:Protoporphyrinogen IX dehydrogenase [quinone] n=1 Tax=Vagococcus entomophilus TaxID=1160095 RepID=A0A430AKS8_9ENTE|nr:menaquinone-dependent protoporphyrinogen IX dehydrogenase [Vagococcus entomophilus]RSU08721.1 hypothetical protein CBF30_05715 [Vagococcus entomophilus]